MIYNFNVKEIPPLSQVGGKAKALIETTKAGFKVPEGIVLSVDFFDSWIKELKQTGAWVKFAGSPVKENCDLLKSAAGKLKLSGEQKQLIDQELSAFSESTLFAVRSSSPEEDMEDTSFAGVYESFLGVTPEKIQEAVKKCFGSLFDERVIRYKEQNGLDPYHPRIAIIIQKQIASEVSGVAFTLNPVTNYYDECVINANFGLGDSVVEGTVTADQFIVDKVSGSVIGKKAGNKEYANYLLPDGGTGKKHNASPRKPCLTDEQILEVSTLAVKVEGFFQKPTDIEWAFEKGRHRCIPTATQGTHQRK